jgi:hypothetical protein
MTVSDQKAKMSEQQRKMVAEELWLNYFNRVLFERGIITESERNRMTTLIANRPRSSYSQKKKGR